MSRQDWINLRERLAGKWQIPLFALSLAALYGAWSQRPSPKPVLVEDSLAELSAFASSGLHDRAIQKGEALLKHPECGDECKSRVRLQLARGRLARVHTTDKLASEPGMKILADYDAAAALGQVLTADDHEAVGRIHEARGDFMPALEAYEKAAAAGFPHEADLQKKMAIIARGKLDLPGEAVLTHLDAMLDKLSPERPDQLLWAIEQKLDMLEDIGRLSEAEPLVDAYAADFDGSHFKPRHQYLQAWVQFKNGNFAPAETALRALRNGTIPGDDLHGMSGWLLGRVILDGDRARAAEALTFFDDVIRYHRKGMYTVASRIGKAEALLAVDRVREAIDSYGQAVEELRNTKDIEQAYGDVLVSSLSVKADALGSAGQLRAAVDLSEMAVGLIDKKDAERGPALLGQLARFQRSLAEEIEKEVADPSDSPTFMQSIEAKELLAKSAENYLALSRCDLGNEPRAADAHWQAAELFSRAGESDRAIQLFREFMAQRPAHPMIPRACLRTGQIQRQSGRIAAGAETFRECYERYPLTLDGARTLIPLAQCYLALGAENLEAAAKTLDLVLEDSVVFTPQAPEFADALALRAEVQVRQGNHEAAIGTLHELVVRYPDEDRACKFKFMLAEGYRNSGLAVKREIAEAKFLANAEQAKSEASQRFLKAREHYRDAMECLEGARGASQDRLGELYYRHSLVYEADCLFECGRFGEALPLYEAAASRLRDRREGLSASTQIVQCHVFLGRFHEARAALERARLLVKAIPEEALSQGMVRETREQWTEYLDWLADSKLF